MFKTLKSRISLIYISLIAIICFLGIVSMYHLHEIDLSVKSLITTNYNSIVRLTSMNDALAEQQRNLEEYLYVPDQREEAKTSFSSQQATFEENYENEYATIIIKEEMQMITNINAYYNTFLQMYDSILQYNLSDAQQAKEAISFYRDSVVPQMAQVRAEIESLKLSNETALFSRRDDANKIVQRSSYLLAGLFVLSIFIAAIALKLYTNNLFKPIYNLTQNFKAIRQGNMNRKTYAEGGDELTNLCNEFNNMTQRLSEFEQSTMGSLMEEKKRTDDIMRSISEPMVILNGDCTVMMINDAFARTFHVTSETSLNRHFLEVISRGPFLDELSKLDYHTDQYFEKTIHFKNDKDHYYNVMLTPLSYQTAEGSEKRSIIIVFYDITELKMLEKMRSDFIATISHELKTPLTSILMGADLLDNTSIGPLTQDQREIVTTIKDDSNRLCNLVNDLLALSKVESASTIYQMDLCSVTDIIRTSLKQFYPLAGKSGVMLRTQLAENMPKIMADQDKITWVLNNLLSNALKYTSDGDSITIFAQADDENVTVSVQDTGAGIPADFVDKIFDKYVQVPGYDLEMRGSGIGLSVSKEIITAHHGKIWCESSLNVGSTFHFVLPIRQPSKGE
jgi:signal transduction histidine kinase